MSNIHEAINKLQETISDELNRNYEEGKSIALAQALEPYDVENIEELIKNVKNKAIDEVFEVLRNPLTVDALVSAKDKFTVLAILKRQYEQLKEQNNEDQQG